MVSPKSLINFIVISSHGTTFLIPNPLVAQVVKDLPSTETIGDQSLAVALMEGT